VAALARVHVGSLLTRETAPGAPRAYGPMARSMTLSRARETSNRMSGSLSGPLFWTHVHMTCFTDKRYEDREYLYTSVTCTQRQPGYVSADT